MRLRSATGNNKRIAALRIVQRNRQQPTAAVQLSPKR
jgi:hypothetical protein